MVDAGRPEGVGHDCRGTPPHFTLIIHIALFYGLSLGSCRFGAGSRSTHVVSILLLLFVYHICYVLTTSSIRYANVIPSSFFSPSHLSLSQRLPSEVLLMTGGLPYDIKTITVTLLTIHVSDFVFYVHSYSSVRSLVHGCTISVLYCT